MFLSGQKYEFAKQWKIHIVSPKWLYDSLDIGYSLEESNYPVGQKKLMEADRKGHATSTPTNVQGQLWILHFTDDDRCFTATFVHMVG